MLKDPICEWQSLPREKSPEPDPADRDRTVAPFLESTTRPARLESFTQVLVLAESNPEERAQTLLFTHLDGMDTEQYQNSLGDEEEEEDDDSSFVQDIADSNHHTQNANTSSFSFGGRQQQQISIDPALDTPPPENHSGENQHHHNQQQHAQQNHFVNTQIPRQIYTDIARSASQFSLQDHGGAGFSSPSPVPPPKILPAFTPTDRSLPDRVVTDETLDDAYVTFILYCNPSVPLGCDTTELRKAFRQPPKSDGKTFNVHHLLQLIEKFEGREIKTWTKLATELGVERTADQSAQKVQQYAVRLKRWMHAMHIDAFFEYILNKPHTYYQQIPHLTSSPNQDQMRDGVPLEEDLALRALHPETRPKRGRRKTDDKDDDGTDKDIPDPKRPHLDTPTPSTADPTSAMDFSNSLFPPHPQSAVSSAGGADGMDRFLDDADPWTAATQSVLSGGGSSGVSTGGGQQFRWRAFPREGTTPSTTQPPITILTSNEGNQTPIDEVPTPTTPASGSKPRSRRRHGPAVSSAWPSSGNPLTGKLRGRPPSNRSVRDGPFSTFPANPTGKGHTIDLSPGGVGITATPTSTPIASHAPPHQYTFRPQQLHLTVPTRTGSHIGIASPASAITPHPHINGNGIPWKREKSPLGRGGNGTTYTSSGVSSLGLEDIERKFSVVLLQADGGLLRVEDAKKISERVVAGLRRSWPDSGEAEERAIATIMGCGDDTGGEGGCRDVRIMKLGNEGRGGLDDLGLGEDVDDDLGGDDCGARYDVRWSVMFGPVKGEFSQVVSLGPPAGFHRMNSGLSTLGDDDDSGLKGLDGLEGFDDSGGGENVEELRKRVAELERKVKDKEREIRGVREKVLKAVVS